MRELLKKADLESHGYKKELTTKMLSENGSDKQLFKKSFFNYKIVDCTRLKEISQELETFLQGKNRILSFSNLFSLEGKWKRIKKKLQKMHGKDAWFAVLMILMINSFLPLLYMQKPLDLNWLRRSTRRSKGRR